MDKAIVTAASNKYFPSLINLLSSIKQIYPEHPKIFVYDLGLWPIFRREIAAVDNVEVLPMPKFCGHWRSCYTWKTYIFSHPLARLNFYLDAGCQILKPLDKVFSIIERDGLLLISQGQPFRLIVPESYKDVFDLGNSFDDSDTIHAGIIGFKDTPANHGLFKKIYHSALAGLTLGFSSSDKWRNKGKDKNIFVRDCAVFRHDMTLLNIFFRKYLNSAVYMQPLSLFHGDRNVVPDQIIWQMRLSYKRLENLKIEMLHRRTNLLFRMNRVIIQAVILFKNLKIFIKRKFRIIRDK